MYYVFVHGYLQFVKEKTPQNESYINGYVEGAGAFGGYEIDIVMDGENGLEFKDWNQVVHKDYLNQIKEYLTTPK